MTIANIMTRNVAQIDLRQPMSVATEMMQRMQISCLLVIENNLPVGILTERDVVRGTASGFTTAQPVAELMSTPLRSIEQTASKSEAYHTLIKHGIRHLRVIDEHGNTTGIVSETDFRNQASIEHFLQLRDVGSAMSADILMLSEQASVADAANAMTKSRTDYVLVGENRCTTGILTERDIVRLFGQDDPRRVLREVMSKPVAKVARQTQLKDAAKKMQDEGIRRLVVEDDAGQVIGVLTEHDVVKPLEEDYVDILQAIIDSQSIKLNQLQADMLNRQLAESIMAWKRPFLDLLDNLPLKVFIKDTRSNYIACNKSYADDLGIQQSEIAGKSDLDFYPASLAQHYREDDARVIESDQTITMVGPYLAGSRQTWVQISKSPWHDGRGDIGGVIGIFQDVTHEYQMNKALQRKAQLYEVSSQVNSAIIHLQDTQSLLDKVCDIILSFSGFRLAWIGRENSEQQVVPVAIAGQARDYVSDLSLSTQTGLPGAQGPAATAINENRIVVVDDFLNDPMSLAWHEAAAQYALHGNISLPINAPDFRGALMVYADTVNFFDHEVILLLKELSEDISFALKQIHINTIKRQQETELKLAEQVFSRSADAMIITNPDNNIVRVNQAFCEITGYTSEEVIGKNPRILKSEKQDHDFFRSLWRSLELQGSWQGEIWNRRKNGEIYPEWSSINAVKDASGRVVNYFAVFSDLLQKKALAELDHLKHYDALTDLPNRALLEDRIESSITHARQYERFIGVIFLNLDHFHTVNDMLSHAGGDQVLIATAKRLMDAAPAQASISRLSADTFVIALPDLNTSEEINRTAELIAQKIYQPLTVADQSVQLSARMGISVYPIDGNDATTLMKHADAALADAKQCGVRNSFRFYSSSMNEHAHKLLTMGAELRNAISQNRLVLHYQPQVDIITGQIIGAEALIRINHPERGIISPGEFISVAEETGLIIPMGTWVIREACRQMQQWHLDKNIELTIAINLSPLQLHQSDLPEIVSLALHDSGLNARYLELEFTESAIMKNVRETVAIMNKFKAMGLHLSIDDFGTGYSSLSYLKQFPVDKLKIDQSFVSNITQDPNDAAIVQAIIALGRTLGMTTIAEGVETEAQLGYLRSVNCKEMQGYLYSAPLPAEEFAALLVRGKMMADNKSEKILLLVDDEENVLLSLKRILRREGYQILTATSAEEGLEIMAKHQVNVVLSDQRMPGMSGVEFLRRVKTMHPNVVRMILSGYTEIGTLTDAINKGEIYQFITKPWENEALTAMIREAFVRYEILKRPVE
ncbi:EAL domain-containing protein [Gallionella capsiferriformans]|jgi:diguanylate cyclase (GGDEF)-like protein/PAS domain S-box-containing protein|uniref:Response regulator receiver modulated diguanylate cyclase/phosphodiesterase with PAS/PAC sensor(S) n=1 Tax=Gallionella capsiferriformans (strain ES-2) TaxID=395494 RepID=D9SE93_GALCS|nr:EAL domain-containing protein [Gallionella capsiferriformans]ADL54869.1 response regulator receiver modulated diguanylate cyclase/phosphodiesterase with PAS/PAC sensor(s) [Gallionella capsiferriformans ES-2]